MGPDRKAGAGPGDEDGPGPPEKTLRRLRAAIGQRVELDGAACVVHDVVDEPPLLVLRRLASNGTIQADSFGKAVRRAPPLVEIPVFGADGVTPSEELARVSLASPQAGR